MNTSNQEGFSRVAANATFIIGFARSGTTLLRSLLDNHSELVVFPGELKFFKRIKYLSAERFLSKTDFHLCFEPSKYRIEGVENQDVLNALKSRLLNATCLKDTMLSVIETYAEIERSRNGNKKRWVEKTPANMSFVATLESWFPRTAKYIWIIRDPRDVFASNREKHRSYNVRVFASEFSKHLERVKILKKKVGKRLHMLRYEDLLRKPREIISELADFLEVQFESSMETPTINGIPWAGNSRFGERKQGIGEISPNKFMERLEASEIAEIESRLCEDLKNWGYSAQSEMFHQDRGVWMARKSVNLLAQLEWKFPILQRRLIKRLSA